MFLATSHISSVFTDPKMKPSKKTRLYLQRNMKEVQLCSGVVVFFFFFLGVLFACGIWCFEFLLGKMEY